MSETPARYWVGFDLGGTKMMAVVVDDAGKPIARKRRKTKAQEGAEPGLDRVVRTIREALEEAHVDRSQLAGVGIGVPGPLDPERGIVFDLPNLGWHNVPVAEALRGELGCPVVAANDVDAGTYGEYVLGAAVGARSVLGVFPGTGIGGGFVYDGQIFRGRHVSCMEIGHIRVLPDGPLCGCGRRGCLEAVASRLAIAAQAASAAYRGEAPRLLAAAGTSLENLRSGTLAEAIGAGDRVVRDLVVNAARWLGVAIGTLVNVLAPDVVVLGGGLVEAMPDLIVREAEAAARAQAMPAFSDTFRVVPAALGDDATALGAAAWARRAPAAPRRGESGTSLVVD
ncbi:MAG TPA: ROK family protein [Polyangia bacterium]|jgi:glucokinase